MTVLAIAVGGTALILFGAFEAFIKAGVETRAVESFGHLTIFRRGYFDYGGANPAAYGIASYREVVGRIEKDPVLGPRLSVVTPTVSIAGIAGNAEIDASKTFIGTGYVPRDREKMLHWDAYGIAPYRWRPPYRLPEDDETQGIIGVGMARVLGLCNLIQDQECAAPPGRRRDGAIPSEDGKALADLASLAMEEDVPPRSGTTSPMPRLDLLAATASGAPNVMSLTVAKAESQGPRQLDENMVIMSFSLGQKLLYGREPPRATAVVLQLNETRDVALARARLNEMFARYEEPLEVRDFTEVSPMYKQVVSMFDAIFFFISIVMGLIVLFTVVNTMGTSVVERTVEIGTARAMGDRRSVVRGLFVMEGAILGAFGATLGLALAGLGGRLFNGLDRTWVPPGNASPVPLEVLTTHVAGMYGGVWVGLVVIATLAALVPANRAARLEVVAALRHV